VRAEQVQRLKHIRNTRNTDAWAKAIASLEVIARSGEGNLLAEAITATRARATVGEISDALERGFGGRYHATTRVISGIYENAYQSDPEYKNLQGRIAELSAQRRKTPHVLIAKMGQDGHDRGAKVIATAFADLGYTVDVSDMFCTPEEVVEKAIALDVDVIGISSLAAGHLTLVPQLTRQLKSKGHSDIIIVAGGVIPEQDHQALRQAGVSEIFGPGTNVLEAANAVLAQISGQRRNH
jgi:methylmalonyl-CoA mutase